MFLLEKEIIDRCVDFCEGARQKGQFSIKKMKNKHFPQNLLLGNKQQQEINSYLEKGIATREIARIMKLTQPTVISHIQYYQKGKKFYYEWEEFWKFIEPLRGYDLFLIIGDDLTEIEKKSLKRNGILTLGDFLMLFAQRSTREISYMKLRPTAERKHRIFTKIRELLYNML